MRVEIRFYALLAERAGTPALTLTLDSGATVAALWPALEAQVPEVAAALAPWRSRVAVAVNDAYADVERQLHDGDSVAFVPR